MAFAAIRTAIGDGAMTITLLRSEANLQRKAGASEDVRESVPMFREKRAPRYHGR